MKLIIKAQSHKYIRKWKDKKGKWQYEYKQSIKKMSQANLNKLNEIIENTSISKKVLFNWLKKYDLLLGDLAGIGLNYVQGAIKQDMHINLYLKYYVVGKEKFESDKEIRKREIIVDNVKWNEESLDDLASWVTGFVKKVRYFCMQDDKIEMETIKKEYAAGNWDDIYTKKAKRILECFNTQLRKLDASILFRGVCNIKWLDVEKGDLVPFGLGSFSKSFSKAAEFGSVVVELQKDGNILEGIDIDKIMSTVDGNESLKVRGAITTYQTEKEVIIKCKYLKVKEKIGRRIIVEPFIEMQKSRIKLMWELSSEFDSSLHKKLEKGIIFYNDKLKKAKSHKYIKRFKNKKGQWEYIYKEKKLVKKKEEKVQFEGFKLNLKNVTNRNEKEYNEAFNNLDEDIKKKYNREIKKEFGTTTFKGLLKKFYDFSKDKDNYHNYQQKLSAIGEYELYRMMTSFEDNFLAHEMRDDLDWRISNRVDFEENGIILEFEQYDERSDRIAKVKEFVEWKYAKDAINKYVEGNRKKDFLIQSGN